MNIERHSRIVITGGGSGLGRALALELSKRGARLWITDLTLDSANRTVQECLAAGASEARAYACDVRRPEAFEALARQVKAEWQGLDLLVNNAGVAIGGPFESYSLEDWHWTLDTNLWGVIHGCHVFYPMMRKAGKGAILNVASAAGLLSPPRMAAYNVSKAGVVALSETLRTECLGTDLKVSVVCPMFFQSGLFEKGRYLGDGTRDFARQLFERPSGTVEQVALACVRAVEEERFYVLPMWDGRLLWWLKRLAPAFFARVCRLMTPKKTEELSPRVEPAESRTAR